MQFVLNSSGMPFQWTYTASSSASAYVTSTGTSTAVITSTYSSWEYSQVYKSYTPTACCYEQIFTEVQDPRPRTPDWTHGIVDFYPSAWDQFSMSAWAMGNLKTATTPLCRAYYSPIGFFPDEGYSYRSAMIPVDGVNAGFDWTGNNSLAWASSNWLPISRIVGAETSQLRAAVAVYVDFFDNMTYADWNAGNCTNLPAGNYFSGAVQFRKLHTGSSTSTARVTSTSTGIEVYSSYESSGPYILGMEA